MHKSTSTGIRVILVEDYPVVRADVAAFLEKTPGIKAVGEADGGIAGDGRG